MPDPKDDSDAADGGRPALPVDPTPEDEIENIEEEGDMLGGNFA